METKKVLRHEEYLAMEEKLKNTMKEVEELKAKQKPKRTGNSIDWFDVGFYSFMTLMGLFFVFLIVVLPLEASMDKFQCYDPRPVYANEPWANKWQIVEIQKTFVFRRLREGDVIRNEGKRMEFPSKADAVQFLNNWNMGPICK